MNSIRLPNTIILSIVSVLLLISCTENVLVFPDSKPARVRIVNITQDVSNLEVSIDKQTPLVAERGGSVLASNFPAGRPVSFTFSEQGKLVRRDTLYYTLGSNANLILFVKGSAKGLVEFFSVAQQDTVLPRDASNAVLRFTHGALESLGAQTVLVFANGTQLMTEEYDPGITSSKYYSLAPGLYNFELRDAFTNEVVGVKTNVQISAAQSYMLFSFDLLPVQDKQVGVSIF